jgi:hypothetical protein
MSERVLDQAVDGLGAGRCVGFLFAPVVDGLKEFRRYSHLE